MTTSIADRLWGPRARLSSLLLSAAVLLFIMLGARELWTQEWRWANISWNMLFSGDYLHPYLENMPYYDKPLLSYWLMIACSKLLGGLSEWALRLPPALAGLLTVFCTYKIGTQLVDRRVGLIAGWMLATTFYFLFWARTANTDVLNIAGVMLAVMWYFARRDNPSFFSYSVFFLIVATTCLCKGLIGAIIPALVILPDLLTNQRWRTALRWTVLPALLPALLIYLLPFWASEHFNTQHYQASGLYQVFRENVLRYFEPYDHKGPFYTYFVFLPVYMLPWAFFFLPALWSIKKRWQAMNSGARWFAWSTLLVFLFLTFSGSRRDYYTLPLLPFATLLTADWIASGANTLKRYRWAGVTAVVSFVIFFIQFGILQPLHYAGGLRSFGQEVRQVAGERAPWSTWHVVLLDTPSKVFFYVNPAHPVQAIGLPDRKNKRNEFTTEQLLQNWPMILHPKSDTILVTRILYLDRLASHLKNYQIIVEQPSMGEKLLHLKNSDRAVAFIPKLKQADLL